MEDGVKAPLMVTPEETGFAVKMKCFLHLCFKQCFTLLKVFEEDRDQAGGMIITQSSFTSDMSHQPLNQEM